MSRTARFGRTANYIQSATTPLTDDQLKAVAPSIFAPGKHESRSDRYSYIPTAEVLKGLRKEGFEPYFAIQSGSRVPGKADFTKHMLRLRHVDYTKAVGSDVNEILLANSHDGTSAYKLMAGIFVFVCTNGLITGDFFADITVNHKGNVRDAVVEGAFTIMDQFKEIDENKADMKAIELTEPERNLFATSALTARYGSPALAPVTPTQILAPRRYDDAGSSIWSVFNRTQENLVEGGLEGRSRETNRRVRTRSVRAIDGNTALNRALFTLAQGMKDLKQGKPVEVEQPVLTGEVLV